MIKFRNVLVVAFAVVALSAAGCARKTKRDMGTGGQDSGQRPGPKPTERAESGLIQIAVIGTNDIHGGVEASEVKDGTPIGGLAYLAGVVNSIREGVKKAGSGKNSAVVVLDAGDQFQGTLLSNYNEGKLVFESMSEIGYDAAVPGNHDYDFGPVDWTVDQKPETDEASLRGAFREAIKVAKFPLVSANTYLKSSIADAQGTLIPVNGTLCKPIVAEGQAAPAIDWTRAKTLDFLKPYVIQERAGLRIAIIGLDNPTTPTVTTPHNVTDLCFSDEAEAYLRVRKELEGKADVFLVAIHNGNINADLYATSLVTKIKKNADGINGSILDAVIAGHTHTVNNLVVEGVPIVQSGSGGRLFGRIDLFYDRGKKSVDQTLTVRWAGVQMLWNKCSGEANAGQTSSGEKKKMCAVDAEGNVSYEGVPVVKSEAVLNAIAKARQDIAPIAGARLGTTSARIDTNGTTESPLANYLTDALRKAAGTAEISFMNTGGIRAPLNPRGLPNFEITYEDLFKVLPFNNRGVLIGPMKVDKVLEVIKRSARVCSADGGMQQSGLKITITRNCRNAQGQTQPSDPNAVITRVEKVSGGEVIVDNGNVVDPNKTFQVVTLDFLKAGGSGYTQFIDVPLIREIGIARDSIRDVMVAQPTVMTADTDGRWTIIDNSPRPQPSPVPSAVPVR